MPSILHRCLLGTALLYAAPAFAQDPFDGTWKGDVASATVAGKPDDYLVMNGTYACRSCTPAYKIAADGAFHAVKGKDYWDETAFTVIDDHTVRQDFRKGGKLVSSYTETVSPDGGTATFKSLNTNNGAGTPVEAVGSQTRLTMGPKGSHLVSGTWKQAPAASISAPAVTMTIAVTGDAMMLKTGTGETLNARFGGPYAANAGDPGKTMTKVERVGPRTIRMTDMRGGKIVGVADYTVEADGRKMTGKWRDPSTGQSGTFAAYKQ